MATPANVCRRISQRSGYQVCKYFQDINRSNGCGSNVYRYGSITQTLRPFSNVSGQSQDGPEQWDVVPNADVHRFITDCMQKVGTLPDHADSLAANLVTADYRGHYSHGLNRLDMYIHDIETGVTENMGAPQVLKENAATAHVDGKNLLGPVVGNFCMNIAIQKARTAGVGWVTAKNSNHYGIAGWYAMKASEVGLLGLSFTNTSPLSVPTRASKPILGTNPLSLAAPSTNSEDPFVLDMATTTVALGKIELHSRKQIPIPSSWGVDSEGKECHEPSQVVESGALMPLGGSELTGGYKGYGLAMLVEIFCGILAGSDYGPNIRRWKTTDRIANLGQCFIAVDPDSFAPDFDERMTDMMAICRSLGTAPGASGDVLVAGDPERQNMQRCDERGGIPYHPNQIAYGEELAKKFGVPKMQVMKS